MKKMDQVGRTYLGTVGSLPLTLTILHYNVQQQTDIDFVSLHVLIRIQDQNRFSFFGAGNCITVHLVCGLVGYKKSCS